MELIRRAIDRARGGSTVSVPQDAPVAMAAPPRRLRAAIPDGPDVAQVRDIALNADTLEANRIVAHDVGSPLRKPFDILRTQVLQSMDEKDLHILAVTSPTPGCGKSVVAINLALSIARQPQRSVLLMDMDLQRPRMASYLGVKCEAGLIGALEGRLTLQAATSQLRIGNVRCSAILAEGATRDSSEWLTSQAMTDLLQSVRRTGRSQVVIIDLPPMLTSDDVIAILPHVDGVLFVAAAGVSTVSEIEDCSRHLQSTEVVRVVFNKAPDANVGSYYY